MSEYRIGKLKGRYVITWRDDTGRRRRYRLDAQDARAAAVEAPGIYAELNRPKGKTIAELWNAYIVEHHDRAIVVNMAHNWKALKSRFASMHAATITTADCRAHTAARRRAGIRDGTIATELGRLRMVLRWAQKQKLIAEAPAIERPSPPKRRDKHFTRKQCQALVRAAVMPHVKLYIVLALGTAARNTALLELTWDRCDFARNQIDLRNPNITRPHKGRAIVPMNRSVRAALLAAREGALSDHVIEWAGEAVRSVRRGLKAAGRAVGIGEVSPHLLRHSAAVHMAESGVPMEEIAQYLGHDDVNVTRRIYARFSPTYLRKAAAVLEYDDLSGDPGSTNQTHTTFLEDPMSESADEMLICVVGATGIEPVTPTMSR